MKLLNIYSVGIGALLLGLISTPAMAVTIDLFSDVNDKENGEQVVIDTASNGIPITDTDTFLTGVIGGQRTLQVNKRNGSSSLRSLLIVDPSQKNATFSSDNVVRSDFSITWNGNFGAGGIDLTDGGTQNFFLLNQTNDLGGTLVFNVTDINNNTSTLSQAILPSATDFDDNLIPRNEFFRFANFTGDADLTKASSIKLSSTNTTAGLDMSFALVATSAAVPFEFSPSMGLVFFGGLFGIHRLKKRLKTC